MVVTATEIRKCSTCSEVKSLHEFPRNGYFPDGSVRRRSDCYTCYNICRKMNSKRGKSKYGRFVSNVKHRTGEQSVGPSGADEKGIMSRAQWRDCLIFFKGGCAYCGHVPQSRTSALTKEHIIPVVRGGKTSVDNIVPACGTCNSSKCDSDMERWFGMQSFYSAEKLKKIREWVRRWV